MQRYTIYGKCCKKYAILDESKIDVKESQIEGFQMIEQFL
jgi:hypothetical protein